MAMRSVPAAIDTRVAPTRTSIIIDLAIARLALTANNSGGYDAIKGNQTSKWR
jgi:hypothetical protein